MGYSKFAEESQSRLQRHQLEPCAEMYEIQKWLPPISQVLDLGSGVGRNSLFLAEYGHVVHAVDISLEYLEELEQIASETGYPVMTEVADLNNYTISEEYDLIIAHDVLHELPRKSWKRLIPLMKEHTVSGGFNLVAVRTDLVTDTNITAAATGVFHESELFTWYRDWPLLERKNYIREVSNNGYPEARHSVNKVIAQKV